MIAFSRLVLGVHYVTDIIASYIIITIYKSIIIFYLININYGL